MSSAYLWKRFCLLEKVASCYIKVQTEEPEGPIFMSNLLGSPGSQDGPDLSSLVRYYEVNDHLLGVSAS